MMVDVAEYYGWAKDFAGPAVLAVAAFLGLRRYARSDNTKEFERAGAAYHDFLNLSVANADCASPDYRDLLRRRENPEDVEGAAAYGRYEWFVASLLRNSETVLAAMRRAPTGAIGEAVRRRWKSDMSDQLAFHWDYLRSDFKNRPEAYRVTGELELLMRWVATSPYAMEQARKLGVTLSEVDFVMPSGPAPAPPRPRPPSIAGPLARAPEAHAPRAIAPNVAPPTPQPSIAQQPAPRVAAPTADERSAHGAPSGSKGDDQGADMRLVASMKDADA